MARGTSYPSITYSGSTSSRFSHYKPLPGRADARASRLVSTPVTPSTPSAKSDVQQIVTGQAQCFRPSDGGLRVPR